MDIKPVKHIEKPKYPLKEEVSADALKSSVPIRWTVSAAAKVALGSLAAMTLAGCVPDIPLAGVPEPPATMTEGYITVIPTDEQITGTIFMGEPLVNTVNVAPLFLHGEGRGAYGCVMVAPPVFLSEEDALTVINEAAKEYGLKFQSGGSPEFEGVPQPITNIYGDEKGTSDKTISIKPDFADNEHGVVIEFVSVDDVKKWHQETGYAVSVETYATQDAADQISDGLEQVIASEGYYTAGVLYDPCEQNEPEDVSGQEEWDKAEAKARAMSEQQLKAQAIDFFEWLKQQGVI